MKSLTTVAIGMLLLLTSGCINREKEPQTGPLPPASSPTSIEVTNNNWLDMVVYASRAGFRVRLGTVTSLEQETFSMPATMETGGEVRLIASPIGLNAVYQSDPISVSPGQRVAFTIENQVGISTISVW